MIVQLPPKAPRIYRGKYPTRIHSFGYSGSPSQTAIAEYLEIKKPVHIELNNGYRYIVAMSALRSFNTVVGIEFHDALQLQNRTHRNLSEAEYDEMLGLVRQARERQNK